MVKEDSIVVITTDSLTIGESAVISATVNGDVSDNIKYIINGVETDTIDKVEAINYVVVAVFEGNSTHKANSTSKSFVVGKKDPSISISVEDRDNLVAFGYSKLTITVAGGDASGFVLIEGLDTVLYKMLENGVYILDPLVLPAGEYNICVTYMGDDKYNKISDNIEFNVSKGSATPYITGIVTPIRVGSDVSFVVSVVSDSANGATGTVDVYVDGVFNQSIGLDDEYNNASVTIKGLWNGTHIIGVKYNGDDNYDASLIVNSTVVVNGKVVDPETVFINPDSSSPETFGINLPFDATGNFTVVVDGEKYGSVSLVDGKANITVGGLSNGSHNIGLFYSGDDNYSGIGKNHTIVVVNGDTSPVGPVSPGSPDSVFDLPNGSSDPLVFSIDLPVDASGNFTVSIGGKEYNMSVVDGKANITVEGLSDGSYPVVVSYSGDSRYAGLFKTASIKLDNTPTPTPTPVPTKVDTVVVAKKKVTFNKSKRSKTKKFTVTLKTKAGKFLAGQKVFFKLDKKILKKIKVKGKGKKAKKAKKLLNNLKKGEFAVMTKVSGKATLTLKKSMFKFKKGKGKLICSFKAIGNYKASSCKIGIVLK